jgi:hypothetical protein
MSIHTHAESDNPVSIQIVSENVTRDGIAVTLIGVDTRQSHILFLQRQCYTTRRVNTNHWKDESAIKCVL